MSDTIKNQESNNLITPGVPGSFTVDLNLARLTTCCTDEAVEFNSGKGLIQKRF